MDSRFNASRPTSSASIGLGTRRRSKCPVAIANAITAASSASDGAGSTRTAPSSRKPRAIVSSYLAAASASTPSTPQTAATVISGGGSLASARARTSPNAAAPARATIGLARSARVAGGVLTSSATVPPRTAAAPGPTNARGTS